MISYRLTSLILGLVIAGVILLLIRKDLLHTKYSLIWFLFSTGIVFFGAFPQVNDWIAVKLLGIHYAPIFFVIVGMCVILIKMLAMDIDRSKLEQNIRKLNEKMAVLEGETHPKKNSFKD